MKQKVFTVNDGVRDEARHFRSLSRRWRDAALRAEPSLPPRQGGCSRRGVAEEVRKCAGDFESWVPMRDADADLRRTVIRIVQILAGRRTACEGGRIFDHLLAISGKPNCSPAGAKPTHQTPRSTRQLSPLAVLSKHPAPLGRDNGLF